MCPACMAAAAVAAAKVASVGGLAAFGVKKLLSTPRAELSTPNPQPPGDSDESDEDRNAR